MQLPSEQVISELLKFVIEQDRLPVQNEPGLIAVIESAIWHFGSLEEALVIAGFLPPTNDLKATSLKEMVKQILVSGPMTLKEIRKELKKSSQFNSDQPGMSVYQAIKNTEAKSIGPRRRRVYFLPGQEALAQDKLTAALCGFSEEDNIVKSKILDHLKYPMTKSQIEALFIGKNEFQKSSKIYRTIKKLERSRDIFSIKFVAGYDSNWSYLKA